MNNYKKGFVDGMFFGIKIALGLTRVNLRKFVHQLLNQK